MNTTLASESYSPLFRTMVDSNGMAAVWLVFFVIGLFWLFFPVMIWGQMRQVIKLLKQIRDSVERVDENTHKRGEGKWPSSSIKYGDD